jgi:hypothetical protein
MINYVTTCLKSMQILKAVPEEASIGTFFYST